jgi:MFS family permease
VKKILPISVREFNQEALVVMLGFLLMMLSAGSAFYAFGLFIIPFEESFGWQRSEISGAIGIHFLAAAICGPIAGKLMDNYSNKIIIITGLCISSASYLILPQIFVLVHLYVLWGALGVGNAFAGVVPVGVLVSRYFNKNRGVAMGIAMSGIAFGGLVMTPILGYAIQQINWGPTAIILGLTLLILPVPFVYLIIKDEPIKAEKGSDQKPRTIIERIPRAMKTPSYWLAGSAFLLASAATVGVIQHQASFLRDYAMSPTIAALGVGITAGIGGIGKLAFGYISDRVPVRYASLLSFGSNTIALTLLLTSQSTTALWIYVVFFGLGMGAIVVLVPLIVGELFGDESFGTVYGSISMVQGLGLALGPWAVGIIFDLYDSYIFAFQSAIGMYIIATIMIFMTKPMNQIRDNK